MDKEINGVDLERARDILSQMKRERDEENKQTKEKVEKFKEEWKREKEGRKMNSDSTGNAPVEVKEKQVFASLETLRGEVEGLEKAVEELNLRLRPVLRHEEGVAKEEDKPEPSRVPLAQMVYEEIKRIFLIRESIFSLLNRLEL